MAEPSEIVEGAWGLSWVAGPKDPMRRAAHALVSGRKVWLVDPFTDEPALTAARRRGRIAGVVQLLDRHNRDCASLAERFGVEHLRLPDGLPGTPFELSHMVWVPRWREAALWWEAKRTLFVPEAIGTVAPFAVGGAAAGIHPFLRGLPPGTLRSLRERQPEVLLCGHGAPLAQGVGEAIDEALHRSRRDIPRAGLAMVKAFSPLK